MAPFGLTYAVYVAIVGGSMIAFDPPPATPSVTGTPPSLWQLSLGRNDPKKGTVGQDGIFTLEYRPETEIGWRFKPLYVVGASVDGAGYVGVGVRKDYTLGPVQVTPFIGPVLYQSQLGNTFNSKELIQFRTGFDVLLPISKEFSAGMGYYHVSNAALTGSSAGLDVTKVTLQYKF
jgi:hypothetical protein